MAEIVTNEKEGMAEKNNIRVREGITEKIRYRVTSGMTKKMIDRNT